MQKNLEILWEGYLPLSNVKWQYDNSQIFSLSKSEQKKCDLYWQKHLKKHPSSYDGELLSVSNIEYTSNEIIFHLGKIRYSQIAYLFSHQLAIENSLGALGFQTLIYNLTHTHILIGKRNLSGDYRPGIYGTPGGLFEQFDVKHSITKACVREIQEETMIAIKPETMRLLAIFREVYQVSVGLIIEVETLKEMNSESIEGNDEWEKSQLQWYSVSDLKKITDDKLMDSLFYLKNIF